MLQQALRANRSRGQTARMVGLPAPFRGLNARDRQEESKLGYAAILDNFYPGDGEVTLRSGYAEHATGLPALPVETIMEYASGATRKQFSAVGTEIYETTSAGAVGSADVSSLTNAQWSHTMHATTAGSFLVAVNGADGVRTYSGSAWASQTINNVTAADLDYVTSHKARLWFIEKDTLSAWYLATLAISGDATEFPLAALCKKGGKLVAAESWSVDTGEGADDFFVFVTSEGECLVYAGTDPSSANTWALKGIYQTDRPIGRRCLLKFGADLFVLTESGIVSVAALLGVSSRWAQISELVRPDFLEQSMSFRSTFGWQMAHYRRRGWLVVNVPGAAGTFIQFGYNSQLKPPDGWFTMSNMNASCWGELNGDLYFGTTGTTYKADTGTDDDGDPTEGEIQWAWFAFGTAARKRFTLARPHMKSDATPSPLMDMKVDYDDSPPLNAPTITVLSEGADWDVGEWDNAIWGGALNVYSQFNGITGLGHVGGLRLKYSSATTKFSVVRVDIAFEPGGFL